MKSSKRPSSVVAMVSRSSGARYTLARGLIRAPTPTANSRMTPPTGTASRRQAGGRAMALSMAMPRGSPAVPRSGVCALPSMQWPTQVACQNNIALNQQVAKEATQEVSAGVHMSAHLPECEHMTAPNTAPDSRILVVDDDEDILRAATLLLRRHFASIQTLSDPS